MLELICQQTFKLNNQSFDLSPYRNHGTALDTAVPPDSAQPGSGAIRFPLPDSRVAIAIGPDPVQASSWQFLKALRIEVLARIDPRAARTMVLAAADGSFRFGILEGALEAIVEGPGGTNTYARSADEYAPDGKLHTVPGGRWVQLGLSHDGFAKMQLSIDGALVGETLVNGGVPPVGAAGVAIGNAVGGGLPLLGDIDEMRIWRLDPKEVQREFLGRPYTPATAACWEAIFRAVIAWMQRAPDQAKVVMEGLRAWQDRLARALFLLPHGEQAYVRGVLHNYARLWYAGNIDGPEMADVLHRWLRALVRHGMDPAKDAGLIALAPALEQAAKDAGPISLDCDPAIQGFLALLQQAIDDVEVK